MSMVGSGQIQLGGSATSGGDNRSIALELEVGGTSQADMNASAYRTLAGKPSGQIKLSDFYNKDRYVDVSVTLGGYLLNDGFSHDFDGFVDNSSGLLLAAGAGIYGSVSAFGSRSPTSVFGYTIGGIYTMQSTLYAPLTVVRLNTAGLAKSTFYSIYNSNFGTLLTSAATLVTSGSITEWAWIGAPWYGLSGVKTVRFYKTS